jgi:glutamine amidotransferase-like uncharacterized protein
MRHLGLAVIAVLSLCAVIQHTQAESVLVYHGPGSCREGCARAAAQVAWDLGEKVKFVGPERIAPKVFQNVRVWIQPGGDAIEVATALDSHQKKMIRDFVFKGGSYLGFCAGAFFADTKVDDALTIDGLALLPGTTYDLLPGQLAGVLLPIAWEGKNRAIYFEQGSGFRLNPINQVDITATYPDATPAVISFKYGKGLVIVSGVHPEAPLAWKEKVGLRDPDGEDMDLARELLGRALSRLP